MFKGEKLDGLYGMWLKAILKHPYYYSVHVLRFLKRMWFKPVDIENAQDIQRRKFCSQKNNWLDGRYGISFSKKERCLMLAKEKNKVYRVLRKHLPFIPTIAFVIVSFIGMLYSGFLFLKKDKNSLLLFSLVCSGSGIISYIVFAVFSPTDYYRYMHPALILPILSVIGIAAYQAQKK